MRPAGIVLVVAGYVVALPIVVRMRRVFGERRTGSFLVFEGAMGALVVGYLVAGRPVPAAINGVAALVLAGAWWEIGRRARSSAS